jgi:hypothetical protein
LVFSVKSYVRQSNHWEYISPIGSDGYFHGKAIFPTKEQADRYLQSYQTKQDNRLTVYGKQITASLNKKLRLKVFVEEGISSDRH